MEKVEFTKYKTRGAGYHWEQNSNNPIKMNSFVKARYQKCVDLAIKKIGNTNNKKIIDLGCGDGVLTYELYKKGFECYGVDISSEAIKFAKNKHNVLASNAEFYVESCINTHFNDEFFDVVVSSDVIEHLSNPADFLKEIKRLLKPSGVAIISTPIRFTEKPLDKMHAIEWFKEEYSMFINESFSNAVFEYSHPVFWYEMINRSLLHRILVNFISYFNNPFTSEGKWRFVSMQYAIIQK